MKKSKQIIILLIVILVILGIKTIFFIYETFNRPKTYKNAMKGCGLLKLNTNPKINKIIDLSVNLKKFFLYHSYATLPKI